MRSSTCFITRGQLYGDQEWQSRKSGTLRFAPVGMTKGRTRGQAASTGKEGATPATAVRLEPGMRWPRKLSVLPGWD